MTPTDKATRLIHKALVENRIGIAQEKALTVLNKTAREDEWVADLIHEVTSTTGVQSVEALARLLYLFGIGTIVEGRLN